MIERVSVMNFMKVLSTAAALVLSANAAAVPASDASMFDTGVKYEFEDGSFNNCKAESFTKIDECASGNSADISDWSGTGFANITQKGSAVTITVDVPDDGLYELIIRYCQPFDLTKKVQYLNVNGSNQGEVSFPYCEKFEEMSAGYIPLKAGKNDIEIKAYWGYTLFDYMILKKADPGIAELNPERTLSNPDASDSTKRMFSYFCDVYGKHIISGQQEYCGSHSYNLDADPTLGYIVDNEAEFEYILDKTGKMPAIRGIDFINYSSAENMWDDNAAERAVEWTNKFGGICAISWHWSVPSEEGKTGCADRAFYVESANPSFTTFSISNALTEGTWENEVLMKDIEVLASKFQLIEDADVPVMFRPLHEAEGAWFWWGAEGAEPCKELYRLLYDQLTNVYGLDNIIWVWTSSTFPTSPAWYPGDEYVDMIGYDKYNAADGLPNLSSLSSTFYNLVASRDGKKLVCMSENDSIPAVDGLIDEKAGWLWFCPWYNNYLTSQQINPVEDLIKMYKSEYCITLDELPDFRTYPMEGGGEPGSVTTPAVTAAPPSSGNDKFIYGDLDDSGVVDLTDLSILSQVLLGDMDATEEINKAADVDVNGKVNLADLARLKRYISKAEGATLGK